MQFSQCTVFVIVTVFFLIIDSNLVSAVRKNSRKRKQQQRQFEEPSLQSSHSFDAIHHTYGASLFGDIPQDVRETESSGHQCQPIQIETCRDIGYNVTSMPNFVGQENQADAELQLQTFVPLISYGCASQLRFFLCSVYTPMCTEKVPISIGPCRPLCESVRARCAPVLLELGFVWPDALNCSKFVPENTVDHMCMEGPPPSAHEEFDSSPPSGPNPSMVKPGSHSTPFELDSVSDLHKLDRPIVEHPRNNFVDFGRVSELDEPVQTVNHMPASAPPSSIVIPSTNVQSTVAGQMDLSDSKWAGQLRSCIHYRHSEFYAWLPQHPDGGRCVPKCTADVRFSNSDKRFVDYWTSVWATLAVLSCVFTLAVFLVSRTVNFKYPERPVIYIALCSLIYSSTYIYRAIVGREVMGCYDESSGGNEQRLLVQRAEFNPHCTLSFLMLYYFGMASAAWFLVLSATWAASYALRTPLGELAKRRTLYHAFAWIVPALQTLSVLVTRAVDADELTGTCSVGNQDSESLLRFVLTPLALYLSVSIALFGLALLCARFVHVCDSEGHCCSGPTHGSDVELSDRSSEQNSDHDSHSTTTGCSDFCRRSNRSSETRAQKNLLQVSSGQSLLLVPTPYTATLSSTASSYNSSKGTDHSRAHPTLFGENKSHSHKKQFGLRSSRLSPFEVSFDPINSDSAVLVRAGIFALFYIVPTLFVLASIIYEYDNRDTWLLKRSSELVESIFQHTPSNGDISKVRLDGSDRNQVPRPNFEIFKLRLFMSLVIGISTGIWLVITRGQTGLFGWRCLLKKPAFESVSSNSSSAPLSVGPGSAHLQLLANNNNALATHKGELAGQTESHFFAGFFPSQQMTHHHSLVPQLAQPHPQPSQYAHHLHRTIPATMAPPHHPIAALSHQQQHLHRQHPGSSVTTSTSVSSGNSFAYPNPNLVLDNHWSEHGSSTYRTGNETAV